MTVKWLLLLLFVVVVVVVDVVYQVSVTDSICYTDYD